jgi:hypothetical protein
VVYYNLRTSSLLALHEDLRSTGCKTPLIYNLVNRWNKGRLHVPGGSIPKEEGENGCEKLIKNGVEE